MAVNIIFNTIRRAIPAGNQAVSGSAHTNSGRRGRRVVQIPVGSQRAVTSQRGFDFHLQNTINIDCI